MEQRLTQTMARLEDEKRRLKQQHQSSLMVRHSGFHEKSRIRPPIDLSVKKKQEGLLGVSPKILSANRNIKFVNFWYNVVEPVFFRPSETVSRIGLMESCMCHRCHCHWCGGPPPPWLADPPPAWWQRDGWLGRLAFTLTKRPCC